MRQAILIIALLSCGHVLAQTSSSYTLEEYSFNAGGAPSGGATLDSAGFSITLASIGDGVAAADLSSGSWLVDVGFEAAYPPPGEVVGLALTDKQTLVWSPERSAGHYTLYRDDAGDGYGNCEQHALSGTITTDPSTPTSGSAFYYLVAVENRLGEEGTRGFRSGGVIERLGAFDLPVCP